MKKIILILTLWFVVAMHTNAQGPSVEFQLASGIELPLSSPSITDNFKISDDPGFGMQFNFQVIFKKVGFMLSYEKSSRIYEKSVINFQGNEVIFKNKIKSNRFMVNFVGRIPIVPEKVHMDMRFGIGRLLNTERQESYSSLLTALVLPVSALFPKSLICMDIGLKTYYSITPRIACFADLSLSFSPYSYEVEKGIFLFKYTDYETSRITLFGLNAGISVSIGKK